MRIGFPDERTQINDTDFCVLCQLWADGPLWKMELVRRINARRQQGELLLDLSDSISKQAVGRRVEGLHTDGLVEKKMIHAEINGDDRFLMAYDLTDAGEDQLRMATTDIIAAVVTARLRGEEDEMTGIDRYIRIYSDLQDVDCGSLGEILDTAV